jgi:hypothetical protein
MERLADALLDRAVQGLNLAGPTLRAEIAQSPDGPTLLVFLRHFGCIFCKEMLRDVRDASRAGVSYPRVIVFCQADLDEATAFFAKHWPEAHVVCDPSKAFYDGVGLTHGTFAQMFGPRVWACGVRAVSKGNMQSLRIIGDPWTMPGTLAVDASGAVVWQHTFQHAGDHPDYKRVPELMRAEASTTVSV